MRGAQMALRGMHNCIYRQAERCTSVEQNYHRYPDCSWAILGDWTFSNWAKLHKFTSRLSEFLKKLRTHKYWQQQAISKNIWNQTQMAFQSFQISKLVAPTEAPDSFVQDEMELFGKSVRIPAEIGIQFSHMWKKLNDDTDTWREQSEKSATKGAMRYCAMCANCCRRRSERTASSGGCLIYSASGGECNRRHYFALFAFMLFQNTLLDIKSQSSSQMDVKVCSVVRSSTWSSNCNKTIESTRRLSTN